MSSLDSLFAAVCEKAGYPVDDPELGQAYRLMTAAHGKQETSSGQTFYEHVLETALIAAGWGLGKYLVIATLLHDVLDEDGIEKPVKVREISREWGPKVAKLVKELSRLDNVQVNQRQFGAYDNLVKQLEMTEDLNVVLIKLASTLQQARTLDRFTDPQARVQRARFLRAVFAPVASRLGMWLYKRELEDLCFASWMPREYAQVGQWRDSVMQRKKPVRDSFADEVAKALPGVEVLTVRRHLYSLYERFQIRSGEGIDLSRIHDFLSSGYAFRTVVLADTLDDCYRLLGVIHRLGAPVNGAVKDSLYAPRHNGYASLDTAVRYQKTHFDLMIRTRALDQVATQGITFPPAYNAWVEDFERQVPLEKNPAPDADGSRLCIDVLARALLRSSSKAKDRVLVRGHDGRAFSLAAGATVLDFAYAVHSSFGDKFYSATVNGRQAPISYALQEGDVVQITTDPAVLPQRSWIDFVHTRSARHALKKYFNLDPELRGSQLLVRALSERGISWDDPDIRQRLEMQVKNTYATLAQLYLAVGNGEVSAPEVVSQLYERLDVDYWYTRILIPPELDDLAQDRRLRIRIARCCLPKYPERIIGGLRGRYLHIHRYNCIEGLRHNRRIAVEWSVTRPVEFNLRLNGQDRPRLVYDIAGILSTQASTITEFLATTTRSGQADIQIQLKMPNRLVLNYLINDLSSVEGITHLEVYEDGVLLPREALVELAAGQSGPVKALKPNPYWPGMPVKDASAFFGRKKEIERIFNYLLPEDHGANLIICAQKRTGKTSLAYRIIDDKAIRQKYIPVYLDLLTYLHADDATVLEAIGSKILQEAARLGFESKAPVNGDPFTRFQAEIERLDEGFLSVHKKRKRVLIILDEFGSILENYASGSITERLFTALRAWTHTLPVAIILIGQTRMHKRLFQMMPGFTDVFVSSRLGGLDPPAARQLITKPVLGDAYYDARVIERILDLTACYPYYIQLLCAKLFSQAVELAQTNIIPAHLDEAVDELTGYHSENYFRHLWDHHKVVQLKILSCLAHLEEGPTGRWTPVEDLVEALDDVPEGPLHDALQDLTELDTIDKIIENDRELVRIRLPLLRMWLQRNKSFRGLPKKD